MVDCHARDEWSARCHLDPHRPHQSLTSHRCEASVSAMKLLKNKQSGHLWVGRLNDLMMVKIMGPSIEEFDPDMAIQNWMVCITRHRPPCALCIIFTEPEVNNTLHTVIILEIPLFQSSTPSGQTRRVVRSEASSSTTECILIDDDSDPASSKANMEQWIYL